MEIRQMAAAYLFRDNRILMIKKPRSKWHDSEFWSGLGGHLEPHELNHPREACIREIYEESGFRETDIQDLTLKYILLRTKEDEIRQQFVYFGQTDREAFNQSDEGELSWIPVHNVTALHMSAINNFMLAHYFNHSQEKEVMIGSISKNQDGTPIMQWTEMKDPEVF